MSKLGDDVLSYILSFLHDKNDRNSFAMVCKQWLRVEDQTRSSIRAVEVDSLQNFLPRFPNLLSFMSTDLLTNAHLDFVGRTCPKLETLNLNLRQAHDGSDESGSVSDFDDFGVFLLATECRKLSKISLRRRKNIGNFGVIFLIYNSAQYLTYLDLGRCTLVDDQALEAIGTRSSIEVLNLDGCSLITDRGLAFLADGSSSKSLKKLVFAECDRVTDSGVSLLKQMSCLEELSLAKCGPKVTDVGAVALSSIKTLKRLDFSWLINVSDISLAAIAKHCKDLEALDLTGCEMITGMGLRVFASHQHLEKLVLVSCFNMSTNDLDVVLQCQSLNHIVLDKGLRLLSLVPAHNHIGTFTFRHFEWV